MSLKVVGAGLGRTGTHSLKLGLERLLESPCYHMIEVFKNPQHVPTWHAAAKRESVDWSTVFEGYSAAVDWPASAFWADIAKQNPDALIVYSRRDPEAWWKSTQDTIFRHMGPGGPGGDEWFAMMQDVFTDRFTVDIKNKEACLTAFQRHEDNVLSTAPPERLLVWQVTDGWEPLCKALNLPVPNKPFPKTNSTAEFQAHVAQHSAAHA